MFVTAYGEKLKVGLDCSGDEVLVEQHHKTEADINNILAKYARGQLVSYVNRNQPRYDDVPPIDFQRAMETVAQANQMYEELPAKIRQRFKDSSEFLAFVYDDKNKEVMYEMGLANRPVSPPATSVDPVPVSPPATSVDPAPAGA